MGEYASFGEDFSIFRSAIVVSFHLKKIFVSSFISTDQDTAFYIDFKTLCLAAIAEIAETLMSDALHVWSEVCFQNQPILHHSSCGSTQVSERQIFCGRWVLSAGIPKRQSSLQQPQPFSFGLAIHVPSWIGTA